MKKTFARPQELHHLERQLIAEAFAPFEKLHAAMKQHRIWSEVRLEHRMETPAGPVVVDALAKSNPNPTFRPLAVEFCNTHPVGPEKLTRLRLAGIPTIEISISDIPPLAPEGLPNRPGILARLRDPDSLAKRWAHEPHIDSLTTRCLEHFQHLATEALTTLKTRLEKEIDPRHFFHIKNQGFKPRKVYEYWAGPGERVRDAYCPQPNTTKVDPDETCTTCPHFGGYNIYQKPEDKKPTRLVMCCYQPQSMIRAQ